MTKYCVYIVFAIAILFLLNGCGNDSAKESKSPQPQLVKDKVVIVNLESKTSNTVNSYTPQPSAYQNKTKSQVRIGEYTDLEIDGLSNVNIFGKLSQEPVTSISHFTIQKNTINKTSWYLKLNFDNDIFSNTDYYYTNGSSIELSIPFMRTSPVNKIFFAPKNYDIEFCGFSIKQNIYTPTDPDTEVILYGDRPFSSYLTIGQFREVYNLTKNIYVKSQLSLGVLGPSSLGGQVQSSIHEIEPVGWENQINDNFVIDYSVQFKKGIVNTSAVGLNVTGNANIGTLNNKIGGGFDFRFGRFMPFYSGPVSMFEQVHPGRNLQYWFFVKSSADIIGYDATLQGGLFNSDNPYTIASADLNRIVVQASAGIAIYYNNIGIEYEQFYLSPEFKGARHFGWGSVKAVIAF